MLASDATEIGWIVLSFCALLLVAVLVLKRRIDRLQFHAGPIQASVDLTPIHNDLKAVREMVSQVNDAVNHRLDHEPTLVQRVKEMEEDFFVHQRYERQMFEWQNESLMSLASQVGLTLPDSPPTIPPKERKIDGTHQ